MTDFEKAGMFGLGKSNDVFAPYFVGKSYLNLVITEGFLIWPSRFLARKPAMNGVSQCQMRNMVNYNIVIT